MAGDFLYDVTTRMLTEARAISEALRKSLQSIGRLCCRGTN